MLKFSTNIPCAAAVILAMDKMHAELTTAVENPDYSLALQAALSLLQILILTSQPLVICRAPYSSISCRIIHSHYVIVTALIYK